MDVLHETHPVKVDYVAHDGSQYEIINSIEMRIKIFDIIFCLISTIMFDLIMIS